MAGAFTAKNFHIDRAPRRISLLGDKTKKVESSQHIIEFPGGAIELSRTTDGNYWAHIIVHRGDPIDDTTGLVSATGEVIGSRLDHDGHPLTELSNQDSIRQIAVLIRSKR